MKYLFAIFLSFTPGVASAQKIHFTDISNKWTVLEMRLTQGGQYTNLASAAYGVDVVIASTNYHVLDYPLNTLALREDTVGGIIYFRFLTGNDSVEHVFFNYNLALGDTFIIDTQPPVAEVVSSVDTVWLAGAPYKKWSMTPVTKGFLPYTFIEGMGSVVTPCWNVHPAKGLGEYYAELRCFTSKGAQPSCMPRQQMLSNLRANASAWDVVPVFWFDNSTSCLLKTSVVAIGPPEETGPVLLLNPGNGDITITLPVNMPTALLQIRDVTGRVILNKMLDVNKTVISPHLSITGVYFYSVQAADRRYGGRFIFQ